MVKNCFNRSSLRRLSRRRSSTPDSNLADLLPDEVIERICLLTLRPDLSFSSSSSASSYAFENFSPLWLTRNDFVTARPLLLLNKRFHAAVYSIVTRFSFFMINGWLDLNAPGLVDSLRKCTNLRELQLVVHDDPNKFSVHNLNMFLSSTRSNIKAVHLSWGTASHRGPHENSEIVDRALCVVSRELGSNLQALALDCCGTIENTAAATIGYYCSNLKQLALAYTYFEDWNVFRVFPKLKELHIRNADMTGELLTSIAIRLRSLESLSLTFYQPHLLEYFRNLSSLPNLKEVHLTHFNMGFANDELDALSKFPMLQCVKLRHMYASPEALMGFLMSIRDKLRSLWIDDKWLGILETSKNHSARARDSRRFSYPVSAATEIMATAQKECPNLEQLTEQKVEERVPHWSQRPYVEALQCVAYKGEKQKRLSSSNRFAVCEKLRNCFNNTVAGLLNDI